MWNHIKRVFLPITSATPSKHESDKLVVMKSIIGNKLLLNYCVWRRSNLLLACPSIFISIILGFVDLKQLDPEDVSSGWLKCIFLLILLTDFCLSVAVIYAI